MHEYNFEKMPEQELFSEYRKTKDLELRNFLVMKHIAIIKHIIGKIGTQKPYRMESGDLFSYGVIGLIEAINKFDPEKDNRFISYAFYRIQGAMVDGIRDYDCASRWTRRFSKKIEQTREALEMRLGCVATQKELACAMGLNDTKFQQMRTNIARTTIVLCTDTVRERDEGEVLSAIDLVRAPTYFEPTAFIDIEANKEIARHLMRHLSYRERTLCIMYFYRGMTCKGIGKALGLSESRISQLLKQLQNKLKTVYIKGKKAL